MAHWDSKKNDRVSSFNSEKIRKIKLVIVIKSIIIKLIRGRNLVRRIQFVKTDRKITKNTKLKIETNSPIFNR